MNNVIFAGVPENCSGLRSNRNYEIIVAESDGKITVSGNERSFHCGEIIVIPPLVKHTLSHSGLHVLIEQALLPFKEVFILSDDSAGGILYAAKQAETYYISSGNKKSAVLAALGELIVAYITLFADRNNYSPVVATVRAEVAKNLSNSVFSLEDFIKRLPLNYDYVRKLFKKETGVTPHAYLVGCRMKLAADLISSGISNQYSEYSVSQIAESCGFAEPLYFSRVFKKYYGISPSEYAKSTGRSK